MTEQTKGIATGTGIPNPDVTKPPTNTAKDTESISLRDRLLQPRSLRVRLMRAFLLLVLLPSITIIIAAALLTLVEGRRQVINQLDSVVTLKENEIDTWVKTLQTSLSVMLPPEESVDLLEVLLGPEKSFYDTEEAYDALYDRLHWIQSQSLTFEEIFIIDLDGYVILSTDEREEDKIYLNQIYFQEGLTKRYVHTPFYSPSLGRSSVVAVQPILDEDDNVLGVLGGRASAARLSEIMGQTGELGETGETYLVGLNHAILTTAGSHVRDERISTAFDPYYVRTEGVNQTIQSKSNTVCQHLSEANANLITQGLRWLDNLEDILIQEQCQYLNYDGVPVIGVSRWYPDLQVALVGEQHQAEAFQATENVLMANVAVAVLALIVAVAAAIVVTRSIARPLTTLSTAATAIEAGNKIRADLLSGVLDRLDELGQFARIFQKMAEQVYAREEELRQQVQELKIVIDQSKREEEVARITESDSFLSITERARELRARRRGRSSSDE
ncbi:MAG: hypothetical protein AAF629_11150 [Chloroflexota bacterium]